MKKIALSVVLALLAGISYAQIPTKTGWNVGVDFGGLYNRMTTTQLVYNGAHAGVTGGITGMYKFRNNVVAEVGLRLSKKGSNRLKGFDPQLSAYLSEMKLCKMPYIEVPVMVGYNLRLSKAVALVPKVGGYFAHGTEGYGEVEGSNGNFGMRISPFETNHVEMGDGSKYIITPFGASDAGLLVGLDVNIYQFTLRTTYGIGLKQISNAYDTGNYHRTLSFSLGYYLFKR